MSFNTSISSGDKNVEECKFYCLWLCHQQGGQWAFEISRPHFHFEGNLRELEVRDFEGNPR